LVGFSRLKREPQRSGALGDAGAAVHVCDETEGLDVLGKFLKNLRANMHQNCKSKNVCMLFLMLLFICNNCRLILLSMFSDLSETDDEVQEGRNVVY
jgi:hypothetical protein